MPPLSAAGPAGTVTDPFVGDPYAGVVPEFDAELWRAAGATDDELMQLTASFDELEPGVRRRVVGWIRQLDSDALTEVVQDWRAEQTGRQRDAEQQAAYDALPQQDKDALAALTPDDVQELAALDERGRAELAALAEAPAATPVDADHSGGGTDQGDAQGGEQPSSETADGDAPPETAPADEPPIEGQPEPGVDPDAPDSTSTEQQDEQTATFLTDDVADLTIKEVLTQVGNDPTRAAAALSAEQARGDAARPNLLKKLEPLTQPE